MIKIARSFIKYGISVIPVSHQGKRPVSDWNEYRQRFATEQELRGWFSAPRNIGVVGGFMSGGLVILDFDTDAPAVFERFSQRIDISAFPVVRTGGGGYHLWLRTGEPIGNKKLARRKDGKVYIESRGEGGYAIAPLSVHPSGGLYEFINGNHRSIPELSQKEFDDLLAVCDEFDEIEKVIQDYCPRESNIILPDTALRAYALGALNNIAGRFGRIVQGSRNNELNIAAFILGRYAGAGLLTFGEVHDRLITACKANKLLDDDGIRECNRTIQNGFGAGSMQPYRKEEISARLVPRTESEKQVGDPDFEKESLKKALIWAKGKYGG